MESSVVVSALLIGLYFDELPSSPFSSKCFSWSFLSQHCKIAKSTQKFICVKTNGIAEAKNTEIFKMLGEKVANNDRKYMVR